MKPIIIFDGTCNFCNSYINKLISIDQKAVFQFTPYASDCAAGLMKKYNFPPGYRDSFILTTDTQYYTKSAAVIQILLKLNLFWKVCGCMVALVPGPLRDMVYDLIARNRYRISRQYNSCKIPTPEIHARFIL